MPLFRVMLRGENFLLDLTGEPELLEFDVTHFVRAADEAEARRIATILTRQNKYIRNALLNTSANPTRVTCLSIKRVWWTRKRSNGRYVFRPYNAGQGTEAFTETESAS